MDENETKSGVSPCLTAAEIAKITYPLVQAAAQVRFLREIGIRAERRRDGSVLVMRAWLAGDPANGSESKPTLKSDRRRAA